MTYTLGNMITGFIAGLALGSAMTWLANGRRGPAVIAALGGALALVQFVYLVTR